MNESRTSHLVKKLGMQDSLLPILNSNGGNLRFERAVVDCLEKYFGKKPSIFRKALRRPGFVRKDIKIGFNFNHAFYFFKQYYGIGYDSGEINEIAKTNKKSRERIRQSICFIEDILRQRHKQDIWYGAL